MHLFPKYCDEVFSWISKSYHKRITVYSQTEKAMPPPHTTLYQSECTHLCSEWQCFDRGQSRIEMAVNGSLFQKLLKKQAGTTSSMKEIQSQFITESNQEIIDRLVFLPTGFEPEIRFFHWCKEFSSKEISTAGAWIRCQTTTLSKRLIL